MPTPPFSVLAKALKVTPLARKVLAHIESAGSISAREAMIDLGITGNSLSRRLTELEDNGIKIIRKKKKHPITGQPFTRYSLHPDQEVRP